jgi:AcrR family transcriptional regulator
VSDATTSGRGPGRPRDPATDEAILRATLSMLAEGGYDGLSIDGIAARAGVGKATIYRRWASKEEVVAAAARRLSEEVPAPDTGDLRRDLAGIVDGLATVFAEPTTARLVGALVARMPHDAALASGLREGFLAARRRAARVALERAQERGEVAADADLELAVDLLAAPFYYRMLVSGAPIDRAFAQRVLDAVLASLTAAR